MKPFAMRMYAEDVKKISAVKEYLNSNLRYHCTIDQLAEKFKLNRNKLSTGFKQQHNIGVYAYLKKLRMEKAKTLLEKGTKEKQVALLMGYKSSSNFCIAFKKYWGYHPLYFRKKRNTD